MDGSLNLRLSLFDLSSTTMQNVYLVEFAVV